MMNNQNQVNQRFMQHTQAWCQTISRCHCCMIIKKLIIEHNLRMTLQRDNESTCGECVKSFIKRHHFVNVEILHKVVTFVEFMFIIYFLYVHMQKLMVIGKL